MNPFDKPFNSWTIDDFQDALKFTWAKEKERAVQIESTPLTTTTNHDDDIVILERGETVIKMSKPKLDKTDTKHTRMKVFHKELQTFIDTLPGKDGKLDVKTIKQAIRKLPQTHPLNTTYISYVEKCNWNSRQAKLKKWGDTGGYWKLTDFDRVANHIQYMKGHYREYSHTAKISWSGLVKTYKNYIATK